MKLAHQLTLYLNHIWWRHQIETFSALLANCAGNLPVTGEFPAQRPVTRSVFFDLRLKKRLSKQSWGWWFETLSRPFWRHRNVNVKVDHTAGRELFIHGLKHSKENQLQREKCMHSAVRNPKSPQCCLSGIPMNISNVNIVMIWTFGVASNNFASISLLSYCVESCLIQTEKYIFQIVTIYDDISVLLHTMVLHWSNNEPQISRIMIIDNDLQWPPKSPSEREKIRTRREKLIFGLSSKRCCGAPENNPGHRSYAYGIWRVSNLYLQISCTIRYQIISFHADEYSIS